MQKAQLCLSSSNLISQIISKLLAKSTSENSKTDFSSILEQLLKDDPKAQININTSSLDLLNTFEKIISKQIDDKQKNDSNQNPESATYDLINLIFLIQNNTVFSYQKQTYTSKPLITDQTFNYITELTKKIKTQAYNETQQNNQLNTKKNDEDIKVSKLTNPVSDTQDLQLGIKNEEIISQMTKKAQDETVLNADLQKINSKNINPSQILLIEQNQDSKKQNQQESLPNKPTIQTIKASITTNDIKASFNKADSFNNDKPTVKQNITERSLDQKQQILQQPTLNEKQSQQNSPLQPKQPNTNEVLTQLKPQIQTDKTFVQDNSVNTDLSNTKGHINVPPSTNNSFSQNNSYKDSSYAQENNAQNQNLQTQNENLLQKKFTIDSLPTKTLLAPETQSKLIQTQEFLQNTQDSEKEQKLLLQNTNDSQTQNTIAPFENISFQKISDTQSTNTPKQPYPVNQIIDKIIELQNLKPPVVKSITIQVNPPSLGQIDVKVSINSAKFLTATIHVENQEIFNLINNNLDSLKANISQQGINVSQISLVSSNLGQQNFTQNQNHQNQSLFQFSQSFNQSSNGQNSFNQAFNQQKQQNYVFESNTKQIKRIFRNPNALLDISI